MSCAAKDEREDAVNVAPAYGRIVGAGAVPWFARPRRVEAGGLANRVATAEFRCALPLAGEASAMWLNSAGDRGPTKVGESMPGAGAEAETMEAIGSVSTWARFGPAHACEAWAAAAAVKLAARAAFAPFAWGVAGVRGRAAPKGLAETPLITEVSIDSAWILVRGDGPMVGGKPDVPNATTDFGSKAINWRSSRASISGKNVRRRCGLRAIRRMVVIPR